MTFQRKSKLTLRLNDQLIEQTKQYAANHNFSVSGKVESFSLRLEDADDRPHSPLVRQLTGILPGEIDVKQVSADHLLDRGL